MDIMCEFRAGKMSHEGTRVVPDTRKGLVRVGRGEEGLVHFQWLDRGQNIVEDDQIIFPDEAVFEKVTESPGRVYILKFKQDSRKFFFWMQEPNADGDSQTCMQVNAYINRSLDAEADLRVPIEAEMSEDTADDDISSRAGNLVESMTADLAGEVTSAAGPVRLEDLQRILSAIQSSGAAADPDAGVGLGDILKPDLVLPLIEDLPIEQLASHLPEGGSWSPGDIVELLQSPPLRQQLDAFTHVLRTGQIDLAQFGVDPDKYKFTVVSFLEALEDSVGRGASEAGDKDAEVERGSGNDAMDES
ncbi:hypothetical protein Zm00014a_006350 [Zea mays]|uniref:Uncharacterized protein n=1 Tax=Zea mays TaxID=4577 RepID=A0A3L6E8A1_MAIZE|nr:hypothetical protein Zm00014a_006350 [Zea mays]